jgi:plasmid stabilization system protein ParE
MTRAISLLPAARVEIIEAFEWYEARGAQLGAAFQAEADRQILRISEKPLQFPVVLIDIQRARLRRFPYSLFFRVLADDIFVIACFHASRDPRIWEGRS